MEFKNFEYEVVDNVLVAYWNMVDRSMNVINDSVIADLENLVDYVKHSADIKGAVIASKKRDFSAGADLTVLENSKREYERILTENGEEFANNWFFLNSSHLSRVYRKLETCGKPFACAINGVCLGGAFELALACHYRVVLADDRTKVGLPEVKVGLFPGAGGTQRVARLLETDKALQFLLKGNPVDAMKAVKMGLADMFCPTESELVNTAKKWVLETGDSVARWDKKDFKLPSGKVFSPKGMMVWPAANALYRKETYDNYPGARAILTSVYEGLQVPFDVGLRIESRWFANVLRSTQAEAMIRTLFLSKTELEKGARRPVEVSATNLKKIGVIGAGLMGAGIAYISAKNGLEVVLIDSTQERAEAGKASVDKLVSGLVSKGRAKAADKDALLGRIIATEDYSKLHGVDLVIEAVFEDRAVKETVIKDVQAAIGDKVVFASNTSTLPITSLAEYALDPANFVGIHFFSPVDKMQLVEVIKGAATGNVALATALDFVRIIKKTPIVVNDCRGFYANRCVLNYVREGHLMLAEGIPPAMIENAAKMAGMPVGPLALNDEVGLDLGWKILEATKKDLGEFAIDDIQERVLKFMVIERERFGRKNSKGFYEYTADGKKSLWSGLNTLQSTKIDPDTVDVEELKQRFLVIQAIEAARTVAEGIITEQEADVGSIFGFGFPPFTGGTISYINQFGRDNFISLCNDLAVKYGNRFSPAGL